MITAAAQTQETEADTQANAPAGFLESQKAVIPEIKAAIPEITAQKIDDFMEGHNFLIPRALAKAINLFPDPESAFDMWKEYYKTGNDNQLKQCIAEHQFSWLQDFRLRMTYMEDVYRKRGWGRVFNNAVVRGMENAVHFALTPFLIQKIQGLELRHAMVYDAFRLARHSIESPGMKDTPYKQLLAEHVKEGAKAKLVVDLETLRASAGAPLVELSDDELSALKARAAEETKELYNDLVKQSFTGLSGDDSQARHALNVDPSQIPDGQDFGIEIEGFPLSNEKFMTQTTNMWEAFKAEELPVETSSRKLLVSAFAAKSDDSYAVWAITRDPSVINPLIFKEQNDPKGAIKYAGMEIVSPVLNGPEGGQEAAKVFDLLTKKLSFASNDTCGMHIHASLEDTTLEQKKNLAIALVRNEAAIDGLIDEDRRGDKNQYAKSAAHVRIEDIQAAQTISELVNVMCPNGDRNHKFDFTNLDFPGAPPTIQYRCEGGESYLHSGMGMVVVMLNFTKAALDNPNITLDQVLESLGQNGIGQTRKPEPPKFEAV